jgi:kynurenine formamidase
MTSQDANDQEVPTMASLLDDGPKNWGRWGENDEVGALNFLGPDEVLASISTVRQGKTFTLQTPIGHPHGDPAFPGPRFPAIRFNTNDQGTYLGGAVQTRPGAGRYADDLIIMYLQSTSHYDALGHMWYDDEIYNGYSASTTTQGLSKASVLPIAEKGIVGRAVLLDVARYRGKEHLSKGETVTHTDLLAVADSQGCEIRPRDILLIRTGWLGYFYTTTREDFYHDFCEPGLTYSPELVEWFAAMEIPNLVTDTLANEVTADPVTGARLPLHQALMRNLGISFAEIMSLDELAADCAEDGQYDFLYAAAPIKVTAGTGAPVNPIVIK